jgi:hypothetical protein
MAFPNSRPCRNGPRCTRRDCYFAHPERTAAPVAAPAPKPAAAAAAAAPAPKECWHFQNGGCHFGSRCKKLHVAAAAAAPAAAAPTGVNDFVTDVTDEECILLEDEADTLAGSIVDALADAFGNEVSPVDRQNAGEFLKQISTAGILGVWAAKVVSNPMNWWEQFSIPIPQPSQELFLLVLYHAIVSLEPISHEEAVDRLQKLLQVAFEEEEADDSFQDFIDEMQTEHPEKHLEEDNEE